MHGPRLRRGLVAGLLAASLAWSLGPSAPALTLLPLPHGAKAATAQKFPFIQSDDARVPARINHWLFLEIFEMPAPARATGGLREVNDQAWQNMPDLGYTVLRNDARVLSLRIDGEGCGAYCESFTYPHGFAAATGRHLEADDLFTPQGLQALTGKIDANNTATLRKEIAALQRGKTKATPRAKGGLTAEDQDAVIGLYEDCLSRWDAAHRTTGSVGRMAIEAGAVRFSQDRCSNHASRALDSVGEFSTRMPLAHPKRLLTGHGRMLLLGEGTAAAPTSPFGQVLRGTIDGRLPVTMRLPSLSADGPVHATYFYDRYREPISVSGDYRDGVLTLEESESKARLRLRAEGSTLRGEWRQAPKTLPLVLAP